MKFLLDMGMARSTALFLRAEGYDAVHLRDEGLQRLSDGKIVEKARHEGRVIITHDLDFGRLIALSQSRLPSVVTFRLKDMRAANVNQYLTEVISQFAAELESGALISVSNRAIRVRILPVE
jgi:predicted nuclease of predicted toxin-antitoxin system